MRPDAVRSRISAVISDRVAVPAGAKDRGSTASCGNGAGRLTEGG